MLTCWRVVGGMNAIDRLTDQQRRVLIGIAAGMSNAEIGRQLFVGEQTVKTHIRHIFRIMGTGSRAHAAALAVAWGITDPSAETSTSETVATSGHAGFLVTDRQVRRAAAAAVAEVVDVLAVDHLIRVSDYRVRQIISDAVRRSIDRLVDERTSPSHKGGHREQG